MTQRRDGDAGILDLVAADQLGQRQVEQTDLILIDHAAMFLAAEEILAEHIHRRAQPIGARRITSRGDLALRPHDQRRRRA